MTLHKALFSRFTNMCQYIRRWKS